MVSSRESIKEDDIFNLPFFGRENEHYAIINSFYPRLYVRLDTLDELQCTLNAVHWSSNPSYDQYDVHLFF